MIYVKKRKITKYEDARVHKDSSDILCCGNKNH